MKTAQEMKANSVALIDGHPWLIQKAEFTKSGRNSAIVKMKLKNLINGSKTETVYKADDKMEPVILERKEVTLSYINGEDYVFMDTEYNSYELRAEAGPGTYETTWPIVAMGPEKHLAYAVQWFAMALALLALYLYLGWHNKKEKPHGSGHESTQHV